MPRSLPSILGLVAAMVVAAAPPLPATTIRRMPLARVARDAARIVHATVVDVRSGRDASGLPATWVTLDVARSLKGRAARRLTIKQYGAATPLADGTLARVAGLPRWEPGEEVVLFLRAESRLGFTSPVGLEQGRYRVGRGARARRDLDDFLAEVERLAGESR
jgi:hypothetical protein